MFLIFGAANYKFIYTVKNGPILCISMKFRVNKILWNFASRNSSKQVPFTKIQIQENCLIKYAEHKFIVKLSSPPSISNTRVRSLKMCRRLVQIEVT